MTVLYFVVDNNNIIDGEKSYSLKCHVKSSSVLIYNVSILLKIICSRFLCESCITNVGTDEFLTLCCAIYLVLQQLYYVQGKHYIYEQGTSTFGILEQLLHWYKIIIMKKIL